MLPYGVLEFMFKVICSLINAVIANAMMEIAMLAEVAALDSVDVLYKGNSIFC